jgi:hypothetical protein
VSSAVFVNGRKAILELPIRLPLALTTSLAHAPIRSGL